MSLRVRSNSGSRLSPCERVELILSQLDQLPTLPAVAARLLALTTSDTSSARDVVELIEADASVSAAILRMVRRADLGIPGESMTVARAVTLLGFTAVRNAVLSLHVFEALSTSADGDSAAQTRRELWKHNLAVACAAEMIAERTDASSATGEAFVCGLLHDIGKVALDVCLPKSYARVIERTERWHACVCDVEREVFGLDHAAAGKRLVTRWRLPAVIAECVWLHHQSPDALPSSVSSPKLVRIVHLADNLVRRQRIGYSGCHRAPNPESLAEALGVDEAGLERIAQRLPQRMEPFFEIVGLDDSTGRTLYAESLAKANRELGRLNAKLTESNRRLEVRSACFEALGRFTAMLTPQDHVGDVCVAAAVCIRAMLDVDCVVAFVVPPASRCTYVGCAGPADRQPHSSVIDVGGSAGGETPAGKPDGWTANGLVPATEECETLWRRTVRSPLCGPLWMLPFASAGVRLGAVLFTADEQVVRPLQSSPAEQQALSTAIGLASTSAMDRARAEQFNEELLDLNRRLNAAREELVRARSMSMIAEMAAGAAHELNNPLAIISGRAQMVQTQTEDSEVARAMAIVVEHTERATQIVSDLMRFAKPEAPRPAAQRLLDALQRYSQHWLAGSPLRADQLIVSVADADATVYVDPEQFEEILAALLANALEATRPETARLQINSPSDASDETVRIVVEDNGVGMTGEVLEHAVDPFFSYRPAGRGRGLGLSRAVRLADINGGRLWLESTPNVGTTVMLELPAGGSCQPPHAPTP